MGQLLDSSSITVGPALKKKVVAKRPESPLPRVELAGAYQPALKRIVSQPPNVKIKQLVGGLLNFPFNSWFSIVLIYRVA